MPLQILIVPDKFKGTLAAKDVAAAIARGWRKARPEDSLELLPMTDGGDGFEVVSALLHARPRTVRSVNAAHRPCATHWWWEPKSGTAIIESANIIGLAMLPPGKFHPFDLDTFGLGTVLRSAAALGARRCIVGIGGSATNDGGFGLARSLGWEFLDRHGNSLERWTDLHALVHIRAPKQRRWFRDLTVAVDVQNPLLGARGATRVYGQQKGLRREDFARAEHCLGRLAAVFKKNFDKDFSHTPGAGAAGGLGFGLLTFAGARLESGFELFARLAKLDDRLRAADLVITGEGRIDESTFMGKGAGQVALRCRRLNIPCVALTGTVAESRKTGNLFAQVRTLTAATTVSSAKSNPARWLERLAARTARDWNRSANVPATGAPRQYHRIRRTRRTIFPLPSEGRGKGEG